MIELKNIVVDGLVKSGKTRLAEILATEFQARLILDNMDNPFLEPFYSSLDVDNNPLALKTQLIFLLNRYAQQMELNQKGLFHKTTILDYILN